MIGTQSLFFSRKNLNAAFPCIIRAMTESPDDMRTELAQLNAAIDARATTIDERRADFAAIQGEFMELQRAIARLTPTMIEVERECEELEDQQEDDEVRRDALIARLDDAATTAE